MTSGKNMEIFRSSPKINREARAAIAEASNNMSRVVYVEKEEDFHINFFITDLEISYLVL